MMLYDMVNDKIQVHCLICNYGQKAFQKERGYALAHCEQLNLKWTVMDLPVIKGTSLVDGQGTKVVPGRNLVMISMATSLAEQAKAGAVSIATNQDDWGDFPDCRPEFFQAMGRALWVAYDIEIWARYQTWTKREVVEMGRKLGVPLEKTWSCYEGGNEPCGKCDACVKREEALA